MPSYLYFKFRRLNCNNVIIMNTIFSKNRFLHLMMKCGRHIFGEIRIYQLILLMKFASNFYHGLPWTVYWYKTAGCSIFLYLVALVFGQSEKCFYFQWMEIIEIDNPNKIIINEVKANASL